MGAPGATGEEVYKGMNGLGLNLPILMKDCKTVLALSEEHSVFSHFFFLMFAFLYFILLSCFIFSFVISVFNS